MKTREEPITSFKTLYSQYKRKFKKSIQQILQDVAVATVVVIGKVPGVQEA